MAQIKASELAKLLNEHVEKYGDDIVFIYDGYQHHYKTFSERYVSRTHGDRFVIECDNENE